MAQVKRRIHSRDFKIEAVRLIRDRGVSLAQASRDLDVQTYFFRRENMNAKGEAPSWTDHLLWRHAAHTADLFQYKTGEKVIVANALEGPHHPELGAERQDREFVAAIRDGPPAKRLGRKRLILL